MRCLLTTEEPPRVTVDRDVVSVTEGSTVTVTCRATGVPTPVIRWTKSYEPLPSHHQVWLQRMFCMGQTDRRTDGQTDSNSDHYV